MTNSRISGPRALLSSLAGTPRHWRMLVLWVLASLVFALVAVAPLRAVIESLFGHNPDALKDPLGQGFPLLTDGFMAFMGSNGAGPMVGAHILTTFLMAMLLSPLLCGMLVSTLRQGRVLGFGELLQGGGAEYFRLFRLWFVAIIPFGIAIAITAGLSMWSHKSGETAILASTADHAGRIAMILSLVVLGIAHCSIEAARGWFGAEPTLRSAWRAWMRGIRLLLRRPVSVGLVYLVTLLVGAAITAALAWAQSRAASGTVALLLAQVSALGLAWARASRLVGLSRLAGAPIR